VLAGGYFCDETTVGVQMHDRRGHNHQAYLWQYGRPGASVVFDFRLGRGRDGPKQFLGQFEGILQTDGYIAYEKVGGPKIVHAACWTHARRGFYDAHKVSPDETIAKGIVHLIDELFGIDAEARAQGLGCERDALRRKRARHCWRRSNGSKRREARLCHRASSERRSNTRSDCGPNSNASWITQCWS
jgi:hypothetical protein